MLSSLFRLLHPEIRTSLTFHSACDLSSSHLMYFLASHRLQSLIFPCSPSWINPFWIYFLQQLRPHIYIHTHDWSSLVSSYAHFFAQPFSTTTPRPALHTVKGGEISPYGGLVHLLSAGPLAVLSYTHNLCAKHSPGSQVPNQTQFIPLDETVTLALCWVNWKLKYSDKGMTSPDYNHLNLHLVHHTFLQFQKKVSLFLMFKPTFWYLWACSISYSIFGPHLHLFLFAGSFS